MDLFDLMTVRVSGKEPKTVAERERFDQLRFQIAREEKQKICSNEKQNLRPVLSKILTPSFVRNSPTGNISEQQVFRNVIP